MIHYCLCYIESHCYIIANMHNYTLIALITPFHCPLSGGPVVLRSDSQIFKLILISISYFFFLKIF